MSDQFLITLLGYTEPGHTNWYPWNRFREVISELGYDIEWVELDDVELVARRRLFICWNSPDSEQLVRSGKWQPHDVVLQKVTSLGRTDNKVNWGDDPKGFFKTWKWPLYRKVERLLDSDVAVYAFGCRTRSEDFPEKHRIVSKLGDRLFWIPWGSSVYSRDEIQAAKPIMGDFKFDIGFVGSIWGRKGRGNLESWHQYILPILSSADGPNCLAGIGSEIGPVSDARHKRILKSSALCPIVNAPSWQAEGGVQDRFWTVFTSGRFGVVDVEGIYDFFNEDEVVCAEDPYEYVDKSLYFLRNPDKQRPYIEKVLTRIQSEYNYYQTWSRIIEGITEAEQPINPYVPTKSEPIKQLENPLTTSRTAFVLGNGPSLNEVDMEKLRDMDTISFNRAYIAYEDWGFDPTYYMVIDYRVLANTAQDINKLIENSNIRYFFIRDVTGEEAWNKEGFNSRKEILNRDNVIFFKTHDEPRLFDEGIVNDRITYWGDVSVCSLQVLYLLGYERIMLLGCDCNYQENDIQGVKTVGDEYRSSSNQDVNHFRPDYFGAGTVYSRPFGDAHFRSWREISEGIKQTSSFDVVSGSTVSRLNEKVWDFVPFDTFYEETIELESQRGQ